MRSIAVAYSKVHSKAKRRAPALARALISSRRKSPALVPENVWRFPKCSRPTFPHRALRSKGIPSEHGLHLLMRVLGRRAICCPLSHGDQLRGGERSGIGLVIVALGWLACKLNGDPVKELVTGSAAVAKAVEWISGRPDWTAVDDRPTKRGAIKRGGSMRCQPYRGSSRVAVCTLLRAASLHGKRQAVRDSSERGAPIQAVAPIERRRVRTCRLSSPSGRVKSGFPQKRMHYAAS